MAMAASVLETRIHGLLPELERVYADIHAHPELSMQETRIARIAADRLRSAGYEVTGSVGQTGVVGLLRNGDGPTVMLRADMDALPVREQTGLPYASTQTATDSAGKTVPVMHACGHDMHVTWLIGASTLLAETRCVERHADASIPAGGGNGDRRPGDGRRGINHGFLNLTWFSASM
jgi:hippurate hydrolase